MLSLNFLINPVIFKNSSICDVILLQITSNDSLICVSLTVFKSVHCVHAERNGHS